MCGSTSVRAHISRHLDLTMCVDRSHAPMHSRIFRPEAPVVGMPPLVAAATGTELVAGSAAVKPPPLLSGESWLFVAGVCVLGLPEGI